MLTLNMASGNNNQTIWLLRINTATPIYIATKDIALTNTYDGQVLNYDNYLSDLTFKSSIENSGGTGEVSSMAFSISRHVGNSNFNEFFNDLYPASGRTLFTSVLVDFGVCWDGATADTDITWLFRGRIVDYSYEQRRLNFTIFQESEITNKELPYYEVQDKLNNGVSYYPDAPLENIGKTLPITYGDLLQGESILPYARRFIPTVRVAEWKYVLATHEMVDSFTPNPDNRLFEEFPEF